MRLITLIRITHRIFFFFLYFFYFIFLIELPWSVFLFQLGVETLSDLHNIMQWCFIQTYQRTSTLTNFPKISTKTMKLCWCYLQDRALYRMIENYRNTFGGLDGIYRGCFVFVMYWNFRRWMVIMLNADVRWWQW